MAVLQMALGSRPTSHTYRPTVAAGPGEVTDLGYKLGLSREGGIRGLASAAGSKGPLETTQKQLMVAG